MSLQITTSNVGPDVHLSLSGYLDENCELPEFYELIHGQLVLNLAGITMINSLGSRRWLKWVKGIKAKGGILLVNCSSPFITQVNVLQNFIPEGVKVESFLIPYLCQKCNHEEHMLYNVAISPQVPETRLCGECGAESELDIVKSKYFSFLNAGKKAA